MHLRSKTVQQLLSVILSVVMVLSMLPMEVLAQETPPVTTPMDLTATTEDTSGDGWSWTQSTKTLTLTGLTLTVSDDSTHALILPDGPPSIWPTVPPAPSPAAADPPYTAAAR